MKKWTLNSWKNYPAKHIPEYPDKKELDMVLGKIRNFPPLVFAGETRHLKQQLADVVDGKAFLLQGGYVAIGLGSWLGTIMLFNVWGLIWPNQQKILGMKKATDEEKVSARRIALLASRTNTLLSIPMLLLMTNGLSHRALLGL